MTVQDGQGVETGGAVLVVDDEQDIVNVIRLALEGEGYQVEVARNGSQALQTVERRRPDLILLDVNMPGVDGWEVLNQLRAAAGTQTPVVVMTAGYDAQAQALDSGAQGYLGKPFELDDLFGAVQAHIGLPLRGSTEIVRQS